MAGTQLGRSRYQAVVVGTRFGGAVAACRLAQVGMDVAVLERGRRFPPGSFLHVAGDDRLLWHRGAGLCDIRRLNDILVIQAAGRGSAHAWPTCGPGAVHDRHGGPRRAGADAAGRLLR